MRQDDMKGSKGRKELRKLKIAKEDYKDSMNHVVKTARDKVSRNQHKNQQRQ